MCLRFDRYEKIKTYWVELRISGKLAREDQQTLDDICEGEADVGSTLPSMSMSAPTDFALALRQGGEGDGLDVQGDGKVT